MYSTDIKAPLLVSNQQVRPKELLPNGEYLPRELDFKLLDLNKGKQVCVKGSVQREIRCARKLAIVEY